MHEIYNIKNILLNTQQGNNFSRVSILHDGYIIYICSRASINSRDVTPPASRCISITGLSHPTNSATPNLSYLFAPKRSARRLQNWAKTWDRPLSASPQICIKEKKKKKKRDMGHFVAKNRYFTR